MFHNFFHFGFECLSSLPLSPLQKEKKVDEESKDVEENHREMEDEEKKMRRH